MQRVLVLNAGSSSLKFKLFTAAGTSLGEAGLGGQFDRIGDVANCTLKASQPGAAPGMKPRKWELKVPAQDHVGAMKVRERRSADNRLKFKAPRALHPLLFLRTPLPAFDCSGTG